MIPAIYQNGELIQSAGTADQIDKCFDSFFDCNFWSKVFVPLLNYCQHKKASYC